ncbi:hypothetical protein QF030_001545 [Streptomyces rishiriensis]|uniref:Lipoprotein n=1 Tax=Streptomyces rishiriensis TaxID=68264 RepID=A0ABU0NJR3_STRRH|nr:hypothetical protein [Streptomyces rishiriensis]
MRPGCVRRAGVRPLICGLLLAVLSACGGGAVGEGSDGTSGAGAGRRANSSGPAATTGVPGVGDRWQRRIPAVSRQLVAVYGDGKDSADATVVLYARRGRAWERVGSWQGHNGKKGWTADHHAGDDRSPIGVFTLTDAGGVLADPGTRLPYTRSASFAAPRWWARSHWHDFDYVIAIDYNRVKGVPPDDPARPEGEGKGGWDLAAHGPRQRYVGLRQPAQGGDGTPAAHPRPGPASRGGHGGQGRAEGVAPAPEASLRGAADSP